MDVLEGSSEFSAANSGTNYNKKGSLATNAVNVVIAIPGLWKVHADVGFYVRGPHVATNSANTNSQWWASNDEILYEVKKSNMQISMLRGGTVTGTYHLNWLRGL